MDHRMLREGEGHGRSEDGRRTKGESQGGTPGLAHTHQEGLLELDQGSIRKDHHGAGCPHLQEDELLPQEDL